MSLESWRERPRQVLDDPAALRAFAHPVRLALHELLMRAGAMTAADAAREVGVSQALASYHLRQLARYGLVEQAEARDERERPWKATSLTQSWSDTGTDPETSAARGLLEQVMAERALGRLAEWQERRADEPDTWRNAGGIGNSYLYVTPEELAALDDAVGRLLEPLMARIADPSGRPEGARPVLLTTLTIPLRTTETGD
ncbi:helix-turn-helix domain-containing protein [Nonomuraea fuscirosea]|uniref:winged helix-turn-helix domain-containing protein n=1 Tax=Nonomuraea fuscirosea TaxID=1291556 RepID=UPI002DD9E075|nr:helix-turn-helix domain-containing protein [Nonomuraea fuscirosea]WSA55810.1 helix-turn-helix domain-containing protein [Nonomuraea fuscirosea]